MKKKFVLIIALIALVCGFLYIKKTNSNQKVAAENEITEKETNSSEEASTTEKDEQLSNDELLNSFLKRLDELEKNTQEYGENKAITINTGNLLAHIVYPEGKYAILNDEIKKWVDKNIEVYTKESEISSAELSIDSSSYIINDDYISVKLTGFYDNSSYTHPEDLIKTFTYDIKKNKMISLKDIYTEETIKTLENTIIESNNLDRNFIDDKLLANFVFKHDSLEVNLKRGMYTPMSDGNIVTLLNKEYFTKNNIKYFESKKVETETVINNTAKEKKKRELPDLEGKKVIALTFDDGPSKHTNRLLDILKKNNAKATFFVLGNQINKYPNELIQIANDGHQICNHTWDHKQLTKLSEKGIEEELMKTRAQIFKLTNIDTLTVRAPYGSVNKRVKKVAKNLNMHFVHWSIDTLDWKTRNADATYKAIIKDAKDGAIILCHDIHKETVDSIDRVIKKLQEENYVLVTVEELFEIKNKTPETGKVYFNVK